jgi:hypothetical protein
LYGRRDVEILNFFSSFPRRKRFNNIKPDTFVGQSLMCHWRRKTGAESDLSALQFETAADRNVSIFG